MISQCIQEIGCSQELADFLSAHLVCVVKNTADFVDDGKVIPGSDSFGEFLVCELLDDLYMRLLHIVFKKLV